MPERQLTVTVSMISFNDERLLDDCLASIRCQDYNQELIQILLVDGGSTDKTAAIAASYKAKLVSRPDLKDMPGTRGGMALTLPDTDLILFFSADNRLQEKDALSKMVQTFVDDNVVACETLRYGYSSADPALSRYFALIGGADPVVVGLGKADRGPYDADQWHSFGMVEKLPDQYKVRFPKDISRIPTLGANGCLIRRNFLQSSRFSNYTLHIDLCADLIFQGHDLFVFLKEKHVVHMIEVPLWAFIRRRLLYAQLYSSDNVERMYSVVTKKDYFRLALLVVANLTLVVPLLRAFRGYWRVKDKAWFLHPLMCFCFTISYMLLYFKKLLHWHAA